MTAVSRGLDRGGRPADVRARGRDDRSRRGGSRLGRRRSRVPRLRHRHRGRGPRPPAPGGHRGGARAARPAVARVQPVLDGADAATRLAPLGAFRRRAGVLLQLRRRGERGGAEGRAKGDGPAADRRARRRLPRPNDGSALRDRSALEVGGIRATRPRVLVREAQRRRVARGRRRSRWRPRRDHARARPRRGRRPPARRLVRRRRRGDRTGARRAPRPRRGPGGARAYRDVLRIRAARHRARPRDAGEGPRERAADRRAARPRGRRGGDRAGGPRLDVRRQPRRVRGGLRRRRGDRRRAPRERHGARRAARGRARRACRRPRGARPGSSARRRARSRGGRGRRRGTRARAPRPHRRTRRPAAPAAAGVTEPEVDEALEVLARVLG